MKHLAYLIAFFVSLNLFGQIDPSDGCAGVPSLSVGTSCVPNSYTLSGAYANGALITASCQAGLDRDDGWYQFVATGTSTTIELTGNRNHTLAVWSSCGGGTELACNYATAGNTATVTFATTPGTTYYIQVHRNQSNNSSSMSGTICIYSPIDGDVPWPGADLGTLSCAGTTLITGNTTGAVIDCTTSSAGDFMYQFTLSAAADVAFELCNSAYDTEIHIFDITEGNCDGVIMLANDDGCGVQSLLVATCMAAGTYVIVVEGSGAAEGAFELNILVSNCGCTGPPNDSPCTATALTVNPTCVGYADDNTGANDSGIGSPGCANYGGADLWYTAVVPVGGQLIFESTAGTMTDGGIAIYSGTCGNLTLISCDDNTGTGNMPYIEDWSLTPGQTIYIRHWENGGDFEGTYDICVYEPDCSANTTNDFCEDPATLVEDPTATFSSATSALYTADNPDGVESVFCGTIQNNSWYQFVATSTTHTFDITSVTGCTNGIQAEVYSYNYAANCCADFVSVSNCYNPASTALGTVTATGLTIGETYILMIDGWAGANCDFTIDGWQAFNVLPVEMVDFRIDKKVDGNRISWVTKSEINNESFTIERSFDGQNFVDLRTIPGAGNSTATLNYSYLDEDFNYPMVYYRLKQTDFDGTTKYLDVKSVSRDGEIAIYPNPTNGHFYLQFLGKAQNDYTVKIVDILGNIVCEEQIVDNEVTTPYLITSLDENPKGIYFVQITDVNGSIVHLEKVVKE